MFGLLWLIRLFPMPVIGKMAWALHWPVYLLARERRHVGLTNVRLCFPDKSPAEHKRLILTNFYYMIRLTLEYGVAWWSSAARIRRLVTIKHLHYVTDLQNRGENIILFYPHFVGFELCSLALNQIIPLVSVYSNQKNAIANKQILQGRQRFRNVYLVSRQQGLRSVIKAMQRNQAPFLYLPDQDFGARDSLFVPFFNIEAATITGLARISKLARAKVVPAIARRIGHRFELEFFPPWDNYPTEDLKADTYRMNTFLEQQIREIPEQYFWLHKRFKTRPPGQEALY